MKGIVGMEKKHFLGHFWSLLCTSKLGLEKKFKFVFLAIFKIQGSIWYDEKQKIIRMIPKILKMFQTIC